MQTGLTILVPVYNEVTTVETLLRGLTQVEFPISREIIAIDDGSTDGSPAVLQALEKQGLIRCVLQKRNRGKGAAVRAGLEQARGTYVVIQDADLELNPREIPSLLEPVFQGVADVCYGSRFLGEIPPATRRLPTYWANKLLNFFSNRINDIRLTDFNTCYKLMATRLMRSLQIEQDSFAIEPEVTNKLAKLKRKIVERPISYRPRAAINGKKIRFRHFLQYIWVMIRYRLFWHPSQVAIEEATKPVTVLASPRNTAAAATGHPISKHG
ncbi:MAG: glycosyltransferase family 2 protein [Planctomycetota bacterium]|jgi:glycosyltransferase involved in cell wall biosynthesis